MNTSELKPTDQPAEEEGYSVVGTGRREYHGGRGGDGGEGKEGGDGGEGKAGPMALERVWDWRSEIHIHGGKGGNGGSGIERGGKGGAGRAYKTAIPLCDFTADGLPTLAIDAFCQGYHLSQELSVLLKETGFETAGAIFDIAKDTLEEAGFKMGQVAELKWALRQYATGDPI
ncbi:hypothetical protein FB451DRAFT_1205957, partial [Mycena latifolia]